VRYLSSNKGWSRASEQAAWELENSSTVTKQGLKPRNEWIKLELLLLFVQICFLI
jgi:hypothetical protein